MIRPSTFSIVAFDPGLPAWGVAVASKFPAVGAVVPWAVAGAGAVATQALANTTYGPRGLELLSSGIPALEAIALMLSGDEERDQRQVGMVDARGGSATYTGAACFEWAGGTSSEGVAVQGNILSGPGVVEEMYGAFRDSNASFPDRLLEALHAGEAAGGDRRGRQSAALLVVKPRGGYGGFNDRWLDYRVDDHSDPLTQLGHLVKLHELYFGESPAHDRLVIANSTAEALQKIMARLGYYQGEINGSYDESSREALRHFIGNENFEDRSDIEEGMIDRPVFEFLVEKFLE
ncbi:MAG TPA: DUF1028 domain-containing protein [Anaerolineales bacterium]|nr:DUF1028 domain-containing protein [Anaerolineales bacterium]